MSLSARARCRIPLIFDLEFATEFMYKRYACLSLSRPAPLLFPLSFLKIPSFSFSFTFLFFSFFCDPRLIRIREERVRTRDTFATTHVARVVLVTCLLQRYTRASCACMYRYIHRGQRQNVRETHTRARARAHTHICIQIRVHDYVLTVHRNRKESRAAKVCASIALFTTASLRASTIISALACLSRNAFQCGFSVAKPMSICRRQRLDDV